MSDTSARTAGEAAIERTGPEPSAQEVGETPIQVHLGGGGDPLMLGVPTFLVGSFALGFALSGWVPNGSLLAIIAGATALGQWVACRWAMNLGESMVACIFGVFAGFWTSLALIVFGLTHNWFGVPPAAVVHTEIVFYMSWDVVIFFLLIVALRLPMVFIGIIAFVEVALTLVILGLYFPSATKTLFDLAAIAVYCFVALGAWAFVSVGSVALGGPAKPSLGPPLIK